MHYIKQKRPEIDRCNICCNITKLTWDHVPPKAILVSPDVYANTLFRQLPTESKHMKHYQSGIKYRTICEKCNSNLLGKYDSEYKFFMNNVTNEINVLSEANALGIITEQKISVRTKINQVLRAICGHFLSMRTEFNDKVIIDKDMREYLKDDSCRVQGFHIYSWFYPYRTIVNLRDATVKGRFPNSHPKGFISVMSIYPLAFLLSTEDESDCQLDDLSCYSTNSIDEDIDIILHLNTLFYSNSQEVKHFKWPVNLEDNDLGALFSLGGHEMMEGSRLGKYD